MKITKNKSYLRNIAEVISGIYIKPSPEGEIAYLQVKDLLMPFPATTAYRVSLSSKQRAYLLKKGDLLFAGKGTTYLCKVFDLDVPAVASTTLFTIRLHTDIVSPDFLCWYLNHPKVMTQMISSRAGSGTPLIHKPTLENIEVVIPDMDTQRRIVELAELQKKEERLLKSIAEKRVLVTNQILMNEINNGI